MSLPELIDKRGDLEALCREIDGADFIAVDTEFIRERTYYPQLCLVQVAAGSTFACVDALALEDLDPLTDILLDRTITKVLHAARQDFEIFFQLTREVPAPLFDTQVAADLCGLGDQEGLAAVAQRLLDIEVDKSHARTDWSRRPLRDEQLQYALDDVIHLVPIYQQLRERLEHNGRLPWLEEDCQRLLDPSLYEVQPDEAWQRLKGLGGMKPASFHAARLLAQWREERAAKIDRPRGWVLRDDVLQRIAHQLPRDENQLSQVKGLPKPVLRRQAKTLLDLIREARACEDAPPPLPEQLSNEQRKLASLMMETVRETAAEREISASTLATRRDVNTIVRGGEALPLTGWRAEVIGSKLESLNGGRQG